MNVPIANHGNRNEYTLYNKLCGLARSGKTFALDWHQGGKYNANACTSIICNHCHAKLLIDHPGLPSKGGDLADADLINNVNEQLVQFLFTEQEIREQRLLNRYVCTIERHWPGSVVTHPTTRTTASSTAR